MKKLYKSTSIILIFLFLLSCQVTPANIQTSQPTEAPFQINQWAEKSGVGLPKTLFGSINYSGLEHKTSESQFGVSSFYEQGRRVPEYALIIDEYRLTEQGEQIATKASLALTAYDDRESETAIAQFLIHFESSDGRFFTVSEGTGTVAFNFDKPDPAYHGNMGYNCHFNEQGSFSLESFSGNLTLNLDTQNFSANFTFQNQEGTSRHALFPWQCAYSCQVNSSGEYNEICYQNASSSGSFSVGGKIDVASAELLSLAASPYVISPKNADGLFDESQVYVQSESHPSQLYRFRFPDYENEPVVSEGLHRSYVWDGKKSATDYYDDGKYTIEVETDKGQSQTQEIFVDNTPPIIHPPRLVERAGRKVLDILVEDPIVNGASAGLDRLSVEALVNSSRFGDWQMSSVNLSRNKVLLSVIHTPKPGEDPTGEYDEEIIVWARDKVFNAPASGVFSFDYNAEAEVAEPLLPEPDEEICEDAPLLLPEVISPLVEDVENFSVVAPSDFNAYRQIVQRQEKLKERLLGEGLSEEVIENYNATVDDGGGFIIMSKSQAFKTQMVVVDPETPENPVPPSDFSSRIIRLLDKYDEGRYVYQQRRHQLLENLKAIDASLYQLILSSTELLDMEYVPEALAPEQNFEDFKREINALQEEFRLQIEGNNTYYLLEAVQTYANLSLLYNHLLRAQLEGKLPVGNAPTNAEDTRYLSQRLETLTEPWQLVNFTANRLKAFKTQLRNKHNAISSEMHTVLSEAEETAYALESLEKDVALIAQQAQNLGAEFELEGETSQGDFSTQAIFAAPVLAPVAAQVGRMVAGRLVGALGKQALRAGGWVLTNPVKATALVANTGRIIAGLSQQQRIPKQQVRRLERQLTGDNLTPERRLEINTEKAEHEALIREIDGVMAMAKKRKEKAKAKAKSSKQAKNKAKNKCSPEKDCQGHSETRAKAFGEVKRDADIPRNQQPKEVKKEPLTYSENGVKKQVIGKDGLPVKSREYRYERQKHGDEVVIQEHSQGHQFGDGGMEGPHFNIRPVNKQTGEVMRNDGVPGTRSHYYFNP